MSVHRLTAIVLLSCAGVVGSTAAAGAQPTDPDLKFVVDTLRHVHPNIHHRITAPQFDAAVATLAAELPGLDPVKKALRIAEVVAMVEDGHTRLALTSPVFTRAHTFPVRVERFADGLYVIAVRDEERALVGTRVQQINGQPWDRIWQRLGALSSADNVWSRMSGSPVLLTMPEVISGLGLGPPDALQIDGITPAGVPIQIRIPAIAVPFSQMWHGRGFEGPAGANVTVAGRQPGWGDLTYRHRSAPYWFVRTDGMLYVQLNMTLNSDDPVPIDGSERPIPLQKFWDAMLVALDAAPDQKLVIDLRYNGGGDNAFARRFVDSIVARPATNRRGKLFVIMGRRTFSAAMNFLSLLEERTAAVFIGEPAGGSPSHFGDPMPFTLPQSQLTLRISTVHWDLGVRPDDTREVMEPSLPAPPTYAAFREGRDPALDAVRSYRDGERLADRMVARFRDKGLAAATALYQQSDGATTIDGLWRSDAQQLIAFGYALIADGASSEDIFSAFEFATTTFPNSLEAWTARGRVNAFVNRWREAQASYERALAIRPSNHFIQRLLYASRQK